MNILNRYVLTSFARVFNLALGAFVGIYLLVDFFEKVDDFIEHQARFVHYLAYFSCKVPLIVTQVIPLAILMGVFMTVGGLSRSNELTAMRSGGISLWRVTAPLLAVSLLAALATLAVNETLVPLCAKKVNYVLQTEVKGKPPLALKRDRLWLREGDAIINIRLATPEQQALRGVSAFQVDDDFRLVARSDAGLARYGDDGWTMQKPVVRRFDHKTGALRALERPQRENLTLAKTPDDFRVTKNENEELGYQELRRLAAQLQAEGYDATRHRVDMQARLAAPFACVIMAFLGIPFALKKGRSSNLAVGVTISVAIGIAFHILQAVLLAFGYSAVLPPTVAAWSSNLLFGLLGIWLMLSTRT